MRRLTMRWKRSLGLLRACQRARGQKRSRDGAADEPKDASRATRRGGSSDDVGGGIAADLFSWLKEGGASLERLVVRDAAGMGAGLFATEAIPAGEAVFSLPTELMLTPQRAASSRYGAAAKRLCDEWREACCPEFLLCLYLVAARACPEEEFHVYVKSLPSSPPGLESWPACYRDALEGTDLGAALREASAQLQDWEAKLARLVKADPATFRPDVFRAEDLMWARGMWRSRHFPGAFAGQPQGTPGCLVPLLDVLNHKPGADVTVRVTGSRLEFLADGAVASGEQVWNNYGDKSNEETLLCYGFAVEDNPEDCVRLSCRPADGTASGAAAPAELRLTSEGLPEELLEGLRAGDAEGAARFVGLFRALGLRHKAVATSIERLPQEGGDERWLHLQRYLEGQLAVLEACLDGLQAAQGPPRKRRKGPRA